MDQEGFLKYDHIYFCQFISYREVWYINLFVLCKTSLMMWSTIFMDIIISVMKIDILHGSGRDPEGWQNLLLSIFELQRSVIYQYVCTLWDKSNGVIKITHWHPPWNQEDPPWIRKVSLKMTRSTFVSFWATEKFDISISLYFVK